MTAFFSINSCPEALNTNDKILLALLHDEYILSIHATSFQWGYNQEILEEYITILFHLIEKKKKRLSLSWCMLRIIVLLMSWWKVRAYKRQQKVLKNLGIKWCIHLACKYANFSSSSLVNTSLNVDVNGVLLSWFQHRLLIYFAKTIAVMKFKLYRCFISPNDIKSVIFSKAFQSP